MIAAPVRAAIELALGSAIRDLERLAGGDINEVFAVSLANGDRVCAKVNSRANLSLFATEARGLRWLAEARALRVPTVIAEGSDEAPFLLLEYIDARPRRASYDEELGRGLARLHRSGAPTFGLDHDNFIGWLPQANAPAPDWATFYRRQRLEPQLQRAQASRSVPANTRQRFERLFARLPELVGDPEPPARLHGDLWGGNTMADDAGGPCLFDPAAYGGHRELDLAMMRLFGGFSERVFAAYCEEYPLPAGHAERVPLYQLYPLLVHVNLFGGSYMVSVERALARYE
jgi:fructosamine-3-kinase